jgi:hypothetical protein
MRKQPVLGIASALTLFVAACGSPSPPAASGPSAAAPSGEQSASAAPPAAAPTSSALGDQPPDAPNGAAPTTADAAVPMQTAASGNSKTVATKAAEIRVEGIETTSDVGSRQARRGHEFLIVDVSFKNITPLVAVDKNANSSPVGGLSGFGGGKRPASDPKDVTMQSTPYVIPFLQKMFWVMSDGRFADTVDMETQAGLPGGLPAGGFTVAKLNDIVRGKLVFEVPQGARYRAFQFYDIEHGHALIPLEGTAPTAAPPTVGSARQNDVVQLAVSEAGFSVGGAAPAGFRYYVVGLRGISRSPKDVIDLPLGQFVFLQDDQGCISPPVQDVEGLSRPFGHTASFPPTSPNEGQMKFLVPDNIRQTRVIVAPRTGGVLTLPTGPDFAPSWPAPQATIDDGSVMKLLVLPTSAVPRSLPAPASGRELVMLDVVAQNLNATQGIDFQGTMQLRFVDPSGAFIQPAPVSSQLRCSLGDTGVIPAASTRRFQYVYDVPAGMPLKLQYRGFEKDEVVVEIKR